MVLIGDKRELCFLEVENSPQHSVLTEHSSQKLANMFFQSEMDFLAYGQTISGRTQSCKLNMETLKPADARNNVASLNGLAISMGSIHTRPAFLIVKPVYSSPIKEIYFTNGRFR
jgi:hypothetical protein